LGWVHLSLHPLWEIRGRDGGVEKKFSKKVLKSLVGIKKRLPLQPRIEGNGFKKECKRRGFGPDTHRSSLTHWHQRKEEQEIYF
jgi:hypothetical protein